MLQLLEFRKKSVWNSIINFKITYGDWRRLDLLKSFETLLRTKEKEIGKKEKIKEVQYLPARKSGK